MVQEESRVRWSVFPASTHLALAPPPPVSSECLMSPGPNLLLAVYNTLHSQPNPSLAPPGDSA